MTPEEIEHYSAPIDLLQDRVIIVTGAGDGIGKAVAKTYAAHGATVVLVSKTIKKLEAVYDEIEAAGGPTPAIYPMNFEGCTVKDYEDMATAIEKEFNRLDGLLNNAGWVGAFTALSQYDVELWSRVITVNLHATFLMTQACIPLLERASDPAIVFSTHDCARAYWGAFGIAKQGQQAMMQMLASELDTDKNKVRVNGIDTGPVRTTMRIQNFPGEDPNTLRRPEEITAPYLYYMGPDSRNLTGENFTF